MATTLFMGVALLIPLFAPYTALGATQSVYCECVRYLREIHGVAVRGNAWTIKPNTTFTPTEGDVLLTTEGPGHAALIVGFEGEVDMGTYMRPAFIRVAETNYTRCKPGIRLIPWNDPEIKGIYRPELSTFAMLQASHRL